LAVFSDWFDSNSLTAHGFCLSWDPALMTLHVVSDALIAASYYSIPLAIGWLLIRRHDVAFGWLGWLFAIFITACGTTHAMGIWTLWHPDYFADGVIKAITAIASLLTAGVLWPILPRLAALPSLSSVLAANEELIAQIHQRDEAVEALKRETAERLKAEAMLRQSQKMEAIGQLTGGVAHDFNNLLQVVQANLEALGMRLDSGDPRRRYLDRALIGTGRGARMTQQLLAFARQQALRPQSFDVPSRIASLSELLQRTLGGLVSLDLPESRGQWVVESDPNQFETALLNLTINARDAMPGGGHLRIDVHNVTLRADELDTQHDIEAGDYVAIAISDTGVGMSPAVRDAAFEPFFTTKSVGQGSGLGLSQVYGFVKQSHGHVTLESTVGEGTIVTLYLRRAQPRLLDAVLTEDAEPGS
jgi:signal transduction histidine kinase